jgi:hypothetical protein
VDASPVRKDGLIIQGKSVRDETPNWVPLENLALPIPWSEQEQERSAEAGF